MSYIVVIRGAGDRKGSDIIDPLLYSLEAKLARGAAEMDANAEQQQNVDLTITYRTNLRLGQLVEVQDAVQGETWRGKITGIAHRVQDNTVTTDLSVLRVQKGF